MTGVTRVLAARCVGGNQRDVSTELRAVRSVDLAHTAGAEQAEDVYEPMRLPGRRAMA